MYIKPYCLKKVYLHTEVISDKKQMFFPWSCVDISPLIHYWKTILWHASMLLVTKNPLRAYICVYGRFSIVLLYIYSTYGSSYKVTGEDFFI